MSLFKKKNYTPVFKDGEKDAYGFTRSDYLPPLKPYKMRLAEVRKKHKYSQTDIANLLSTSQKQYSRWETGNYDIPLFELCALSLFFNRSVDYLLGMTNDDEDAYSELQLRKKIENMHISPYFNKYGMWKYAPSGEDIYKAYQEESAKSNKKGS